MIAEYIIVKHYNSDHVPDILVIYPQPNTFQTYKNFKNCNQTEYSANNQIY